MIKDVKEKHMTFAYKNPTIYLRSKKNVYMYIYTYIHMCIYVQSLLGKDYGAICRPPLSFLSTNSIPAHLSTLFSTLKSEDFIRNPTIISISEFLKHLKRRSRPYYI